MAAGGALFFAEVWKGVGPIVEVRASFRAKLARQGVLGSDIRRKGKFWIIFVSESHVAVLAGASANPKRTGIRHSGLEGKLCSVC